MLKRAIAALVGAVVFAPFAQAGEKPLRHVSCVVVRYYVARYSEPAAEAWARSHGASDAEIETARRCLSGAMLQTAALTK
jgi:hypothetical protein